MSMRSKVSGTLPGVAILGLLWLMPEAVLAQESQTTSAPNCHAECRGLGIDKVKAGDEHCGLVSRERKRIALDAACTLADSKREELQALAQERAENKCERVGERQGCRCEGGLRRWDYLYTNHFSGRCWTESGWAYLIECDREPEPQSETDGDGLALAVPPRGVKTTRDATTSLRGEEPAATSPAGPQPR